MDFQDGRQKKLKPVVDQPLQPVGWPTRTQSGQDTSMFVRARDHGADEFTFQTNDDPLLKLALYVQTS